MTRWVGLLYSTVISPQRRIRSGDLVALAEQVGLAEVRTVLSSGNLIFSSRLDEAAQVDTIGGAVCALYGRDVPVLVRAERDWRALVAANPFPAESRAAPQNVGVRIMAAEPDPSVLERIAAKTAVGEKLAVSARAIWIYTPGDVAKSALFRAMNAAWTGVGTARNASAIQKILAGFDG